MAATQKFSNSSMVNVTKKSPNHSGKRTRNIDTVTIHCMAGQLSVESCGNLFASASRQASSNYGVGPDGRVGLYVDESNRSWCTSSNANDQRAVTIEVASDAKNPYACKDAAYQKTIELVADICKRNGIKKLVWSTAKNNRMNHLNGANMTVHRDYAAKACPGDWLYSRMGEIASKVNAKLGASGASVVDTTATNLKVGDVINFTGSKHYSNAAATSGSNCKPGKATITAIAKGKAHPYHIVAVKNGGSNVYGWVDAADVKSTTGATNTTGGDNTKVPYTVRITTSNLNIRKSPSTSAAVTGSIKDKGIYTIITESTGAGATKWGKLKSGAGWISLDYAQKL